jgi:hypothetical protein
LHRFLKNPGVQVERYFQVLAAVIWPYRPGGGRTPLYPVILDWTKVHEDHVLFAAVPRKKRALPLAYGVYHPQRLRKSQNQLERGMLTLVASLLPQSARLVVLADAGFGQTELIRWLQERQIDYVIRELRPWLRGKTWVYPEGAPILLPRWIIATKPVASTWSSAARETRSGIWALPSAMLSKPWAGIKNVSGLKKCSEISKAAWA